MTVGRFLETLYDVLFNPVAAMRHIAEEKAIGQALAAFLLSVLLPAVTGYLVLKTTGMAKMLNVMLLAHTLGSLMVWFIGAAVIHLIAECFGGRGTALGLLAAMGFAHVPRILAVPLGMLALAVPGGGTAVLLAVTVLIVVGWTLFLNVAAIKGAHGFGGAKAVLVLLTPFLALGAAIVAMVIFIGTAFLPGWTG